MDAFRQQLIRCLVLFVLLISIVHTFRLNDLAQENQFDNIQTLDTPRDDVLETILARRSFYDPAFSDSWSNYFESKRSLFDPAYNDWANTFKRSEN